jgi:hypothetical protein
MFYTFSGICSVFLLAFGAYQFGVFQKASPYVDQKIAGSTTISTEWIEIKPEKSLKRTGDYQEIGLYVEEPYTVEFNSLASSGIRMPDGSVVTPDVELIDTRGNTVVAKVSAARGRKCLTYRVPASLSEYTSVRIRAQQQISLDSVYWSGFIIKNMP